METRPLGTTGHESSVLTLGAIALAYLPTDEATTLAERALDAGVNHVDVAPTYGDAELKLAPFLEARRDEVFLGCKTKERTREGAAAELDRSLDRLGVDRLDLYQFHAVTREAELETILGPEGAMEAVLEARDAGVVDHVGLTSHGEPAVIRAAIERMDLDTVMFPMNAVLAGRDGPEYDYASVIELADREGVGTLGIKAFARGPWSGALADLPRDDRPFRTWYEPVTTPEEVENSLRFALSTGLTTITNAGDPRLVPMILRAAGSFRELEAEERDAIVAGRRTWDTPVPTHSP